MKVYFDTETASLPMEQLQKIEPEFTAPGNLRDPEKIKGAIAEKRADWYDRAALDATTGRVLCIGLIEGSVWSLLKDDDEKRVLLLFWEWMKDHLHHGNTVVGFNSHGFDLPFLLRRSWLLGVPVLHNVREGRYWHRQLCDLMEVWQCGNREQRISLDNLSKALGVGAKNGNGKDFAALWTTDRAKAEEYVRNDVELLKKCAERVLL